jgi:purine-nucleoside phosphorylase
MKELGVERLILLNAAGALNPVYERGDLMLVRDHINLMGVNPLIGNAADAADRFVELASAYDEEMADVTLSIAQMERVRMAEGVLVGVAGPSYETGAELRFLRLIGGDAVSMSTVPEVIFARYLEMRILAISCITNVWDLRRPHPISHEEVLETARRQTPLLEKLVRAVIAEVEGSVQWRRA